MLYLNKLKNLADELDQRGYVKQANILDKFLLKIAQEAAAVPTMEDPAAAEAPAEEPLPALDMEPSTEEIEEPKDPKVTEIEEKIVRTTFIMLEDLREFYKNNFKTENFNYFGDENIKSIQAALDQLVHMYKTVCRRKGTEFNAEQVENHRGYVKRLGKEAERSSKQMRLSPAKVKVDKALFYDPIKNMVSKIERHYDKGMSELQPVLIKARSVREAIGNIIEATSESIAHMDLIQQS